MAQEKPFELFLYRHQVLCVELWLVCCTYMHGGQLHLRFPKGFLQALPQTDSKDITRDLKQASTSRVSNFDNCSYSACNVWQLESFLLSTETPAWSLRSYSGCVICGICITLSWALENSYIPTDDKKQPGYTGKAVWATQSKYPRKIKHTALEVRRP